MSPPYFPIGPTELRGEWTFDVSPRESTRSRASRCSPARCPTRADGHSVTESATASSTLTYIPDHCPTELGAGEHGFGVYHPAVLELADGADLLVHDAQLLPSELAADAAFGHSIADYAVELGRRAQAGSVALFHHRHDRTDDALDLLAARFADGPPRVSVAAEGAVQAL